MSPESLNETYITMIPERRSFSLYLSGLNILPVILIDTIIVMGSSGRGGLKSHSNNSSYNGGRR